MCLPELKTQSLQDGAIARFSAGTLAVTQFQHCDRGVLGIGGEAGQAHAVGVGEAQLGAGMRALRTTSRIPLGRP